MGNNKKKRATNNKKKGGGGGTKPVPPTVAAHHHHYNGTSGGGRQSSFLDFCSSRQSSSTRETSSASSVYYTYKTATQRFKTTLLDSIPNDAINKKYDNVQLLVDAVDYLYDDTTTASNDEDEENHKEEQQDEKSSSSTTTATSPSSSFSLSTTTTSSSPSSKKKKTKKKKLVPPYDAMLQDLNVAIAFRERFSQHGNWIGGSTDEGHVYFIQVLYYCQAVLKKTWCIATISIRTTTTTSRPSNTNNKKEVVGNVTVTAAVQNQFETLALEGDNGEEDDEEEEEEDDDDDNNKNKSKNSMPRRPKPPSKPLTMDALYEVPDRAKAEMFLDTMDYFMMKIFKVLNGFKAMAREAPRGELPLTMEKEIIALGLTVNTVLDEMIHMEDLLTMECPHFQTPYQILACLHFSSMITTITHTVQTSSSSPIASRFNSTMATKVVGETMERVFRGQQIEYVLEPCEEFCTQWKLNPKAKQTVEESLNYVAIASIRNGLTPLEYAMFGPDHGNNFGKSLPKNLNPDDMKPWMERFKMISDDSCLMNTLRVAQQFFGIMDNQVPRRSKFPFGVTSIFEGQPLWNGTMTCSTIRGEMDLVLVNILLASSAYTAAWKELPPCSIGFFPFHTILKRMYGGTERRISFTTAFAFHLMLCGLYALQGHGDYERIQNLGRRYMNRLCNQIETIKSLKSISTRDQDMYRVLNPMFRAGIDLKPDMFGSTVRGTIALWNPLCTASWLAYMTFLSFDIGVQFADYYGYYAMTSHCFNAISQRGLFQSPDTMPIMNILVDIFQHVKKIWNNWDVKPIRGRFGYRMAIQNGSDHETATYSEGVHKARICGGDEPRPTRAMMRGLRQQDIKDRTRHRRPNAIFPEEVSKCYRYYNEKDFSNVTQDELPESMKIDRTESSSIPIQCQDLDIRLAHTLHAFSEDCRFLQFNFFVVAALVKEVSHLIFQPEGKISNLQNHERRRNSNSDKMPKDDILCREVFQKVEDLLAEMDFMDELEDSHQEMATKFETFFTSLNVKDVILFY